MFVMLNTYVLEMCVLCLTQQLTLKFRLVLKNTPLKHSEP